MKKQFRIIVSLALAVLMLAPLSLPTFADMAAPMNVHYDVIVNPGGTVTTDGDFIPEGTVLTIEYEHKEKEKIVGYTKWNGKYSVGVNLADVTNGDVIPEESGVVYYSKRVDHFEVFGGNEINVYAGPGFAYNVLFTVPNGERISGSYYMADWVYVRYGDQGGWICPRSTDVVTYFDEPVTVWVLKDTELLKEKQFGAIDHEGNVLCTIPADTKLDSYYRSVAYGLYYVTYEGQSGWVDTFKSVKVITEEAESFIAAEDGTLCLFAEPFDYEDGVFDPAETLDVQKGDRFDVRFSVTSYQYAPIAWRYIETEDCTGWTPTCSTEEAEYFPYSSDILDRVNEEDEQPVDEPPEEEQPADEEPIDVPTEPETTDEAPVEEPEIEDVTPPETNVPEDEAPDGFFSSPTAIIVFCAVAAVVLALVAAVVLAIIKKKKK